LRQQSKTQFGDPGCPTIYLFGDQAWLLYIIKNVHTVRTIFQLLLGTKIENFVPISVQLDIEENVNIILIV